MNEPAKLVTADCTLDADADLFSRYGYSGRSLDIIASLLPADRDELARMLSEGRTPALGAWRLWLAGAKA